MDVARFSSDSVVIHYVLPVLQMTSYFHTMWPMGRRVQCCMVCRVAMPVDVGASCCSFAGSAGRLAGLHASSELCTGDKVRYPWLPCLCLAVRCRYRLQYSRCASCDFYRLAFNCCLSLLPAPVFLLPPAFSVSSCLHWTLFDELTNL